MKPGDRVAYLGVNTHRLMEAYYGVLEAGAVLLPLNIRLAPLEANLCSQRRWGNGSVYRAGIYPVG